MAAFMEHVRRQSNFDGSDNDNDDFQESHILAPPVLPPIRSLLQSPTTTSATEHHHHHHHDETDMNIAVMTLEDIEICQKLDDEYERALEEREIGYNARYGSVRQSALVSVCFMMAYLSLGTAFFMRQADWSVPNSLLFSIYTITTVGYGNHIIPSTPGFQAYTIFYILIGIASLTIMVRIYIMYGVWCICECYGMLYAICICRLHLYGVV